MYSLQNIKVLIIEAKLNRNVESFSKMDPFCVLTHDKVKYKTKYIDEAGMEVRWDEEFDFNIRDTGEDVKVSVYDYDKTWNDLVGETVLDIGKMLKEG